MFAVRCCPGESVDVPVREEGAVDDAALLFTEVNDSFSIVCEVTYSMPSHDSFSVIVVASYTCTMVSKQEQDVVSWNAINCHLQGLVYIILVLFNRVLNGGVGHDNGVLDVPCIQSYA